MGQSHQETNVFHLIYVSRATENFLIQEIESIERISQINNRHLNVTGILVYGNCRFLQFLEGSETSVEKIFYRISKDSRHHDIDVIRRGIITTRQFEDWQMRLTYPDEIQMQSGVIYKKLFEVKEKSKKLIDHAIESRALLIAFKHACYGI